MAVPGGMRKAGRTIRNLDEAAYRALKAQTALLGTTIEELMNEAIRSYLARADALPRTRSILDVEPLEFPEGDEYLSEEIDRLVYGVGVALYGRALLPEYVFLEVVTVLMARLDQTGAAAAGRALLQSREVDFLPCSEVFLEAFETFSGPGSAGLSFTDAAVVTLARRNDPPYVATFDRGLAAAGGVVAVPPPGEGRT